MPESLRIVAADDEVDMRDFYRTILTRQGHQVVGVAANGRELVELCREHQPDLVVTDIGMPELDGLDAVREISRESPIPAIVVSAYHDEEFLDRARSDSILAYLVKPIRAKDLEPAIVLARQRFREFQALQHQAEDLRQTLEDRKMIERAKGILMTRTGLSEQDAFRRLQRLSNDRNEKLAQIARSIVTAEEAMTLQDH